MVADGARTLIEALLARLRACRGTEDGSALPAAILWADPEGHWGPILASLRATLPELVELGAYRPAERRGAAIWLRCVLDRTVSVPGMPGGDAGLGLCRIEAPVGPGSGVHIFEPTHLARIS